MGTWDEGSFGNDTACDWSYGLEKVNDLRYVETTLDKVLAYGAGEMVTADAAECAVAAAEVIARLKGRWGEEDSYPETTDAWVRSHPVRPPPPAPNLAAPRARADRARSAWRDRRPLRAPWARPTTP